MNRIANVITLAVCALAVLAAPTAVQADDDAPAASLPQCSEITTLNCTSVVTNVIRGGLYCQQLDGRAPRCESYWPFRNPTVNAHAALSDPDAFPADYLPTKQRAGRVDVLQQRLDRKNARLEILRKRLRND